ncbi:LD-carboxypeptidase [Patescibacteria group bacterium]|nr:LD-carboxypeptidase [Patescibacteria group bacterium]
MFPKKLELGDTVAIVAPSRSLGIISKDIRSIANKRFEELGLKLVFGEHAEENDLFDSSAIEPRLKDFHEAFRNPKVKAILTVIGGFSSNQLLRYIDWDLIQRNPKILCGFSDITVLQNAIFSKSGLVTYSGPHYSTFGQKHHFDYTLDHFKKCLFSDESFSVQPSKQWSDDEWFIDQDKRNLLKNTGFSVINEGEGEGVILGGNLSSFNLLQGTEYFPDLKDSILFLEDDYVSLPHTFDRNLQSLIHQPGFGGVRGLVIGRFQKENKMAEEKLIEIIRTKRELKELPLVANVDFGHTDPKITFPVGGTARIAVRSGASLIQIIKH